MQVNKHQLKPNMEQLTSSKFGKAVYYYHAYLTYMKSKYICTVWMIYKLESRSPGEMSITSHMRLGYGRKQRGTKEPLDEGERGE